MNTTVTSFTSGLVLCHLLLSGCTGLPTRVGQAASDNAWRFDAYRITEGRGQLFADANNSYAILPDGAKATRVQAPGDAKSPKWSQQGAVIRIDGCLDKLLIVSEGGDRLVAEATGCPSSLPASAPSAGTRTTATQTRPLADESRTPASPIEPLKQEGDKP